MATEPVLSGEIPTGGVLEVLREIEVRRITGKIRFVVGDESGEVELVAGQLAMDQDPLPDGSDPVEALLAARRGIYVVHSVLPPLPVSQGDEQERRGSLAVHVPADLMAYCEQAGLTGVLEMRNEGRVVEVVYEIGEMLGIRLDGREDADLGEVFAWDQGSFRIRSRSQEDVRSRLPPPEVPVASARPPEPEDPTEREPTVRWARPEPPARSEPSDGGSTSRYAKVDGDAPAAREDTGKQFLRVIEMALTDVVSVREKARASVRSQPPPKARPSVRPPPVRPARNKDSTVRIVWIGGEPSIEQEVPLAARAVATPEPAAPAAPSATGSAEKPVAVEHVPKHALPAPAPPHDEVGPADAPKAARLPAVPTSASSEGATSSPLVVLSIVLGLAIVIALAIYAIQP